jgi:hypothetical protein
VSPQERLAEIAAEIKKGANPRKFDKEIDQLLGTEMEERDPLVEAHWEESYRNKEK